MTTLDELRETFDAHTGTVPDVTTTVAAARAGATRIRRRRRLTAACAVAVVVAVTPVAVVRLAGSATPPVATPPYRAASQLTLSVDPGAGFFVRNHGTDAGRQTLVTRSLGPGKGVDGTVQVYDPGTFDGRPLEQGKHVTVAGHDAYYGSDPRVIGGPVIAWRDPSGAWVVVSESRTYPELLTLAESVRLGTPQTVRGPVSLAWVPGDLPLSYADNSDDAAGRPTGFDYSSTLGFGADRSPMDQNQQYDDNPELPLTLLALPTGGRSWGEYGGADVGPWRTVAGHRVRFVVNTGSKLFRDGPGGHAMVEAGSCGVLITVHDLRQITFSQVERMIRAMSFRSCRDAASWAPVVL